MQKHPGHMPVVCLSEDTSQKCKLLVPGTMKGAEFATVARGKCNWATKESQILAGGEAVPESLLVAAIYEQYKAEDRFLYITVAGASAAAASSKPLHGYAAEAPPPLGLNVFDDLSSPKATAAVASTDATAVASPSQAAASPSLKAQPQVFHMPDNDNHTIQNLSEDAIKARKVLRKYPDRVPVLVKQPPTTGLPELDKKLLVPRTMTCAGLREIMPKHLGIARENIDLSRLGLFMGDVPLKDHAIMTDVYNQYVDDNDGGLQVTVRINTPEASLVPEPVPLSEEPDHLAADNEQVLALQADLDDLKTEFEATLERAAVAESRAEAAERELGVESERALVAQQNVAHLSEAYLAETKKTAELHVALQKTEFQAREESELRDVVATKIEEVAKLTDEVAAKTKEIDDLQARLGGVEQELDDAEAQIQRSAASEAALAEKMQAEASRAAAAESALAVAQQAAKAEASEKEEHLREVRLKLSRMEEQVASETQQKVQARNEAKALVEKLAEREQDLEKMRKDSASAQEQGVEGFVHIGWNQEGLAEELDDEENEFEVLAPSEHNLSTLRYSQRASLS